MNRAVNLNDFETSIHLPRQRLPALIRADVTQARASSALERAKQALTECLDLDEVKEIADEAKAIARYAVEKKGAEELLRLARQIQIRAFRRIGQLLKGYKGTRFHLMSMESTALRIASMEEGAFERALAGEKDLRSPHTFAQTYIPRPPPVYVDTPEAKAKREARWGNRFAHALEAKTSAVNSKIAGFHSFTQQYSALEAAQVYNAYERRRVRKQLAEIQDWIDEMDRQLRRVK